MKKLHIRKGDMVTVITGNQKKKEGKVIKVLPQKNKAIVEGINFQFKNIKPTEKNPKGGIIKKEGPIHISNLMLLEPGTDFSTRIGRKLNDKKKLQRFSKKTGKFIQ